MVAATTTRWCSCASVGAVHRIEQIAPEVLGALFGPGGSTWTKRVPRVGRALSELETPLVLVLDDLHMWRTQPAWTCSGSS